ncbi:flowering-promoting factor 1-like protein 5 [Oryza brachyantha]|uniref:flowering-promoting factor 1-like protein 5 n=1 Tax=Oryza brachyantha TaxID=4533 RepID=UPI001ADA65A2|nr:flowering-promoting factor 1-like protein 5 [Oryza brachyantha]
MSGTGVWVFKDGVMQLEEERAAGRRRLVYVPANETMASLQALERRLAGLGWERYYEDRASVQLHRRDGGADLISLPRDFSRFRSTHMYDVVLKNRDHFKVVDLPTCN